MAATKTDSILSAEEVRQLHQPMEPPERVKAFQRLAVSHEQMRAERKTLARKLNQAIRDVDSISVSRDAAEQQLQTVNDYRQKLLALQRALQKPIVRLGAGQPGDIYLIFSEEAILQAVQDASRAASE